MEGGHQADALAPCSQRCIHAFLDIFSKLPGFREPLAAAVYYTAITQLFLKPYSAINKSIRLNYSTSSDSSTKGIRHLEVGRDDLLNYGFLAQIYLADNVDFRNQFENYIPVNPKLIMEIKGKTIPIDNDSRAAIEELSFIHKKIFGDNGLATKKGSITALYNSRWLYYTLMNNVTKNNKLFLMTFGKLKSFDPPYLNFYQKMFDQGLKIKGIYYTNDKILEQKALKQKALELNRGYSKNIEIRFSDVDSFALRRLIANKMAIDARKVYGRPEMRPSYIGTIYLDKGYIADYRNNFYDMYKKGSKY
jgi:hypothetical protein